MTVIQIDTGTRGPGIAQDMGSWEDQAESHQRDIVRQAEMVGLVVLHQVVLPYLEGHHR